MNTIQVLLFSFLMFNSLLYGQKSEAKYRELERCSEYQLVARNDSLKPFLISKNPITNREYITYLCWTADVYRDYPEVLLKAIPGFEASHIDSLIKTGYHINQFKSLISSNKLTRAYIFNPMYIDYPVTGVTWEQAMLFLNWLSDRYNESILIDKKFLEFYPFQKNESTFTTESYLAEQYTGLQGRMIYNQKTKTERPVNWKDRILIPSFRLPSFYELELSNDFIKKSFNPYTYNKFLNYWVSYYVTLKSNKLTLNLGRINNSINDLVTYETFQIPSNNIIELYFDSKLSKNYTDIIEIFYKYKQPIIIPDLNDESNWKDSLGRMPYILISEDKNFEPIFIKRKSDTEIK